MATFYVSEAELADRLARADGPAMFGPGLTERLPWISDASDAVDVEALSRPRAAQSPKGFFLPAAESVGRYGDATPGARTADAVAETTIVLVGVRACELKARRYLDRVLREGAFEDPAYSRRRDALLMVTCDCVDCTDSCFCTAVGGQPHAADGFDVNLSPLSGGFVVEVGSDRGQAWIAERLGEPREATANQLAERDRQRQAMIERVARQNAETGLAVSDAHPPTLPDDASAAWQHFAADCVECGACTHICPTCHCFYLYDQTVGPEAFERVRTWDSCLFASYHRMAGGPGTKLTPRPRLSSRLANRVLHKFDYSPRQYGVLGCVGCGRCVEACLGEIDIRQVVQELQP